MELPFAHAARTTKDFDLGLEGNRAERLQRLEEVLKLGFDEFAFRLKPETHQMELADTVRVEVAVQYRTRAWQTVDIDLGPGEADPRGQHVLERDAHRVGGAGAGGDPRQLGDRLVVVVPVDQGQLYLGAVAQPGRQAQGDMQPGIARTGDHDRTAAPGSGTIHGVLRGYCPSSWEMAAGPPIVMFPAAGL